MKTKTKPIIELILDKMESMNLVNSKYLTNGNLVYFVTDLGKLQDIYPDNNIIEKNYCDDAEIVKLNSICQLTPTRAVEAFNSINNTCLCKNCSDEINVS